MTESREERIQTILESIDNAMFLAKEDGFQDSIEHVDMSWTELWGLLNELANMARGNVEK